MPTTLIGPGKYKKFLYSTSPKKSKLAIDVEANTPIDVFIVQASNLNDWREGNEYGGASFQSMKIVDAQFKLRKILSVIGT